MPSKTSLPRASSVTHEHLLACLNTVARFGDGGDAGSTFRILDVGCGDGKMMAYVCRCLQLLYPAQDIEIYGFDVLDHGLQPKQFMQRTVAKLSDDLPSIDWSKRVFAVSVNDPWPFTDKFFDMVISNQVMEHVKEPSRFLAEHFRVLRAGGYGIHLFPLKHYIYEGHLLLPVVHRIDSWNCMRTYIKMLSMVGLGKYREHNRIHGVECNEFAKRHADYIYFLTHYLTEGEALNIARAAGFRASFTFSREFYVAKLRSLLGLEQAQRYTFAGRGIGDALSVKLLRYLSSVTLVLEQRNV